MLQSVFDGRIVFPYTLQGGVILIMTDKAKHLSPVFLLLLGTCIQALGIANIHALTPITEGGILGLTLLLQHWTGLSPAVSSLVLSGLCILFGTYTLGRRFLGRTILCCLFYAFFYAILEPFAPLFPFLLTSPLRSALSGAVFVGTGAGLCVRAGGAVCGDDALAMALHARFGWDLRVIYLLSDASVLLLSLTYIPVSTIGYSLLTVILSGQLIGLIAQDKKT